MSVKEKLHKLGVEVEPECLQAIESGGQVYQIGLCGIIQNPDRANYTQFAALSFPAPSFLVENQGVCAERFGQYDGFTFAWVSSANAVSGGAVISRTSSQDGGLAIHCFTRGGVFSA